MQDIKMQNKDPLLSKLHWWKHKDESKSWRIKTHHDTVSRVHYRIKTLKPKADWKIKS